MIFITEKTADRLKNEHQSLKNKRNETVIDLDEARSQGDLSENAGYHAAKAKLREIDEKLAYLHKILSESMLINVDQTDHVMIGSYVKVHETYTDKIAIFRIVGEEDLNDAEDNVTNITYTSLVAKGLLNKSRKEDIELSLPAGARNYIILDISDKNF